MKFMWMWKFLWNEIILNTRSPIGNFRSHFVALSWLCVVSVTILLKPDHFEQKKKKKKKKHFEVSFTFRIFIICHFWEPQHLTVWRKLIHKGAIHSKNKRSKAATRKPRTRKARAGQSANMQPLTGVQPVGGVSMPVLASHTTSGYDRPAP